MTFNSYEFVFVFLPICISLYYATGHFHMYSTGKCILIFASLVFIGYGGGLNNLLVVSVSILFNFVVSRFLLHKDKQVSKWLLWIGVVFNLLTLCFFKYGNDVLRFFNAGLVVSHLLLPLGISFYTFQQIAYLIDTYRNEVPEYSFLDYSLFVLYFPKFLQGPIVYHNELFPQFLDEKKKHLDFCNFQKGLMIFSIGLGKKVLLADFLSKIVDYGYSHIPSLNSFETLLIIVSYTFQLYFDFSGYCDMGIGISSMLNIEMPWNFNSPYKTLNISDFWKRWHITLTRFFTKYIYIPLGGNRRGLIRTYINIMIIYFISGLWHGKGFTFLVWGILHGTASILYKIGKKQYDSWPKTIRWLLTIMFINITWMFFRAPRLGDVIEMMNRLIYGQKVFLLNPELTESLLMPALFNIPCQFFPVSFVIIVLLIVIIILCVFIPNSQEINTMNTATPGALLFTYLLLTLSLLSLSGVTGFLYTNF